MKNAPNPSIFSAIILLLLVCSDLQSKCVGTQINVYPGDPNWFSFIPGSGFVGVTVANQRSGTGSLELSKGAGSGSAFLSERFSPPFGVFSNLSVLSFDWFTDAASAHATPPDIALRVYPYGDPRSFFLVWSSGLATAPKGSWQRANAVDRLAIQQAETNVPPASLANVRPDAPIIGIHIRASYNFGDPWHGFVDNFTLGFRGQTTNTYNFEVPCPTFSVTTTNDSGPGSLRQAILDANLCPGTNIIDFAPSARGTIRLTSGELVIADHLFINGAGPANVVVDGNQVSRVFHITRSNVVTLSGLTISNGRADFGGGIRNDNATLFIQDCTLQNNSADSDGGAIFNDGRVSGGGVATLSISDSTLNGNSANGGGGIKNDGSSAGHAILKIINSTITYNTARTFLGGGIWNDGYQGSASLEITDSTLEGNVSPFSNGGGIANDGYTGSAGLQMMGSRITGSSATGGGAIFTTGEAGGHATAALTNCTLADNLSSGGGGGIWNNGINGNAILTVVSSTLSGNVAGTFLGGAIWNDGFSHGSANLRIFGGTLSGNFTGNYGGAIANDGYGGTAFLRMVNSTLSGNVAVAGGGGIFNNGQSGGSAKLELGSVILDAGYSGANLLNDLGIIISGGYNLSSDDGGGFLNNTGDQTYTNPLLGPLQDNGGPTFTHALLCSSPAIDAGKNFSAFTSDQRGEGFIRIFDDPNSTNAIAGDGADIGAFEHQITCDLPPVADASGTTTLFISANDANTTVILDGSRSYDPDDTVLQYTWFESGLATPLATSVVAATVLPVGVHSLLLVVSDGILLDTNSVNIEIITTAEAVNRLIASLSSITGKLQPLAATLGAALGSIDRSDPTSTINQLLAFQNQVRAQIFPLDPILAEALTRSALEIINAISAGNTNSGGRPKPSFTSVHRQPNGAVQMRLTADPEGPYIIEASSNLVDWEMLGAARVQSDGSFGFEDSKATGIPQRFYRVRSP